ncbi:MAG: TIGR00153 family protein [Gammaproteobacteria bacterium]|nr:TIGR00153 family protein [Gammaproteobacteria bacterium]
MRPYHALVNLFGKSPIRPLQVHMAKVMETVAELPALIEAVVARDQATVNAAQERISALENEADHLKHELRLNLPRSLFLPVERRDLLEILTMQDNVANRVKDIAGLIRGRKMTFPESIGPLMLKFARRCVDACAQAQKAVNELDELVETGFRGAEVDLVQNMITELDHIEKETDQIQVEVRALMFDLEGDLPPVHTMFIYRIIDWIGDVGDCAQRVGSRLQLLLAR